MYHYNSRIFITTQTIWEVKSVHFKKAVAQISILSKLWYFQYKSKQKVPQFRKKQDSPNCLFKMNGKKHKNGKSAKNGSSNFGLIKETMYQMHSIVTLSLLLTVDEGRIKAEFKKTFPLNK